MTDDTLLQDKTLLSIKDVASRLNVSDNFIYQQCIKGYLEHYSFGGSSRKRGAIRCSEEQLQNYLCNRLAQKPLTTQIMPSISAASITTTASSVSQQLTKLMKKRKPA